MCGAGGYSLTKVSYKTGNFAKDVIRVSESSWKLVKNTNYGPARKRELVQRDVFINVQFVTQ